jgi:hypothetical protein
MVKKISTLLHPFLTPSENWKFTLLHEWDTIVGTLQGKVYVEKILNDILVLGVYDSCWMQELYLLSPLLLEKINRTLDQPRIKQLRFKKIAAKKGNAVLEKLEQHYEAKSNFTISGTEQKTLNTITDPQLRELLKQFLVRCHRERK